MKFLVIIEAVPGVLMPPEQGLALVKECHAWARRQRESGRVEAQYALADHAGGLMGAFGIADYESAEQMAEALATYPAASICTFKAYPLVALEVAEKLVDGALAQLAKK